MVKKDIFCNSEVQAEIKMYVGDVADVSEEFDVIDKDGAGEIRFDYLVNWAFKRNMVRERRGKGMKERRDEGNEEEE